MESILSEDPGYLGSYYHLGKLLERKGDEKNAKKVYESGIEIARIKADNHARNELISALENIE